jgi:hypothetical protein
LPPARHATALPGVRQELRVIFTDLQHAQNALINPPDLVRNSADIELQVKEQVHPGRIRAEVNSDQIILEAYSKVSLKKYNPTAAL